MVNCFSKRQRHCVSLQGVGILLLQHFAQHTRTLLSTHQLAEVLSKQQAWSKTMVEVTQTFCSALESYAAAQHLVTIGAQLRELERCWEAGGATGKAAMRALGAALAAVSPDALELEIQKGLSRQEALSGQAQTDAPTALKEEEDTDMVAESETVQVSPASGQLLSPKIATFIQELRRHADRAAGSTSSAEDADTLISRTPSDKPLPVPPTRPWTGIVFVTRRAACGALASLLRTLPSCRAFLRPAEIVGFQNRLIGHRAWEQETRLRDFRAGACNLLVATAVVEEGLDVRHCELVLRFDLPVTTRSYIQSRGRARAPNSLLVLLQDASSPEARELVRHVVAFEDSLRRQILQRMALGEADGAGGGDSHDAADASPEDEPIPASDSSLTYVVESTGAVAGPANALQLLHGFIAQMPTDKYAILKPLCRTEPWDVDPTRLVSTLFLPSNCVVREARGRPERSRRRAVLSAYLEAVKKLHTLQAMSDHLLPAALELRAARIHEIGRAAGGAILRGGRGQLRWGCENFCDMHERM